jgi:hypothetical protein
MTIYTHHLYWIHLPEHTDCTKEGYIGVSNNPNKRFYEHKNASKNRNDKNPYFGRVLNKYKDKIKQTILLTDTEENCYKQEEILRPAKNIGWNANKGGIKPPSKLGWKPSETTLKKRSESLKGVPRNDNWNKNLSESKKGNKNGMYGKKIPCSRTKKIQIIRTKSLGRVDSIRQVYNLLEQGKTIRFISKQTGFTTSSICKFKKEKDLYLEAFPILIQSKTS